MITIEDIIKSSPIISIFRNLPPEDTIPCAEAIYNGGVRAFEIAANSPETLTQIALLREHFGDRIFIGAGTVLNKELAQKVVDAGAQFILTPSTNREVLEFCCSNSLPMLPGVMTPTDVDICRSYGFHTLKLFPAGDLPLHYIKSLRGPFADTAYVAVGGVSSDNLSDFLKAGYIGAGIGSNLIPKDLYQAKDWAGASEHIRRMMDCCHEILG